MALLGSFLVYVANKSVLVEKLEKLARKAEKLGSEPISWTFGEVSFRETTSTYIDNFGCIRTNKVNVPVVPMELHGGVPKLAGWSFLAVLEHKTEGNILRSMGGEIPEMYKTRGPMCDHCGYDRRRNDTYLVVSESGEVKQVGNSCLRDFMGHQDPSSFASMAQYLIDAKSASEESEEWGSNAPRYVKMADYLSAVAAEIREGGWVPKSAEGVSTASSAWERIFPDPRIKRDREVTEADIKLGADALEWAKNVDTAGNDFLHNLRVMAGESTVSMRGTGFAAAMVSAYTKAEARKAIKSNSDYVGTVGERKDFRLVLRKHSGFDTAFGWKSIYIFSDEAGNAFKWGTSGGDMTVGVTYVLTGSIKAHSEYKGEKQTELTRCKVVCSGAEAETAVLGGVKKAAKKKASPAPVVTDNDCTIPF